MDFELYQQQLDQVRLLPANISMQVWIDNKAHPELGTPCWLWDGRLNRNGYGRCCIGGKEPVAHRAIYELLIGPIPEKHILDHKCKVRKCVNPHHMEPVTHRVNTIRGDAPLFQKRECYAIREGNTGSTGPDVSGPESDGRDRNEGGGPVEFDPCVLREVSEGTEGSPDEAGNGDHGRPGAGDEERRVRWEDIVAAIGLVFGMVASVWLLKTFLDYYYYG